MYKSFVFKLLKKDYSKESKNKNTPVNSPLHNLQHIINV